MIAEKTIPEFNRRAHEAGTSAHGKDWLCANELAVQALARRLEHAHISAKEQAIIVVVLDELLSARNRGEL